MFYIHRSGVLTALAWLVPYETAAASARVLCTPFNPAPYHFMQSHIRKVYACSAATCPLHFWQNDRGLLRATAVIRGWTGYRNRSQHRKLTLEKKIIPPLLQGFEPTTFWSRVRRSYHWAFHAPRLWVFFFFFLSFFLLLLLLLLLLIVWGEIRVTGFRVQLLYSVQVFWPYFNLHLHFEFLLLLVNRLILPKDLASLTFYIYIVCLLVTIVWRGQLRDSSEWLQAYRL